MSNITTYYDHTPHKYPANIYLLKVSDRNTTKWCEIRCSGVFINFEHISLLFLVFLLRTLNK